jgi:predicted HicB family RNase H-like nuclease
MNKELIYKGFTASIEYSAVDEVYYGKIVGINDLVNFEGTSEKELEAAFQEAVDDYIETCKQLGKEPNTPAAPKYPLPPSHTDPPSGI